MDDPSASVQHAATLRAAHFDPLCRTLGLTPVPEHPLAAAGYASAASGYVRVHFEQDRGLCALTLGPAAEELSLCSVEEISRRFARIRGLAAGVQRLSLEEQAACVVDHWSQLQDLFSPEHLAETRRWRDAGCPAS